METPPSREAIDFLQASPRLLEFGREREGIDLSKVVLTHHKLKPQGRQSMPLGDGEYPKLEPLSESAAAWYGNRKKRG